MKKKSVTDAPRIQTPPFVPSPEFIAWRDGEEDKKPAEGADEEQLWVYMACLMARASLKVADRQKSDGNRRFMQFIAFLFFVSSKTPGGFPLQMDDLLKLVRKVQTVGETCPLGFVCKRLPGAMTVQQAVLFEQDGKPDELMCNECASAVIENSDILSIKKITVGRNVRRQMPPDDAK